MNMEQAVGKVGSVDIGGRIFTVGTLTQGEEIRLFDRLRDMLKAKEGTFLKANQQLLAESEPQDRHVIIAELVRMEALREPLSSQAVLRFRCRDPKAVAFELHTRSKKYHPEVQLAEIEAIITEANAIEVAEQIEAAISGVDPKGNAGTRSTSPA